MLTIVGALVAFDRWPNHADAEPETVPIADDGPDADPPSGRSPVRPPPGPARQLRAAPGRLDRRGLARARSARGPVRGPLRQRQRPAPHRRARPGRLRPDQRPGQAARARPRATSPPRRRRRHGAGTVRTRAARRSDAAIIPRLPGGIEPSEGGAVTDDGHGGRRHRELSPEIGQPCGKGSDGTIDATTCGLTLGRRAAAPRPG